MNRIAIPIPDQIPAPPAARCCTQAIGRGFPNLMKMLGSSPAALGGYPNRDRLSCRRFAARGLKIDREA